MEKRPKRAAGYIHLVLFLVFCLVVGSGIGLLVGSLRGAPDFAAVTFDPKQTTVVYDINNEVITKFFVENRIPVSLEQIPKDLQNAIVAIEDSRFYQHHGVDLRAIARAIVADIRHRKKVEGGSTITQQLAKNAFLTHDKTWGRKFAEVLWAFQIERKYTKEEILEKYLNEVLFGHGAYGVEAAAQLYFGKSVSKLNLPESALIAGLTRSPSNYSPYNYPENAKRRRNLVLERMAELGYISEAEREKAQAAPIEVMGLKPNQQQKAPYFSEYILQYLLDRYESNEVFAGGLKVYTTLDLSMQKAAEEQLIKRLPNGYTDSKGLKQPQGALIAVDPRTGHIKAMVGGRGTDKFNRTTQALRQPGSAIKPFIYTAAIANGYSPYYAIVDEPISYALGGGRTWAPTNYDRKFRGEVTLMNAIADSVNVVAVKLLDEIGVDTAIDYAKKMGITSIVEAGAQNDRNLSFALGGLTRGVSPLEMATAYGVLANRGVRVEPIAVLRVEDRFGYTLEENRPRRQTVLSEDVCVIMTEMLRGVIERGTGRAANPGRPAAGKTGTTNDNTNVWFVGYTPELVAAVWIGNDSQSRSLGQVGSGLPARIWGEFIRAALTHEPVRAFPVPARLQQRVEICVESGMLAGRDCPEVEERTVIRGLIPSECTLHTDLFELFPELDAEGKPLPGPDGNEGLSSEDGLSATTTTAPPVGEHGKITPIRVPICTETNALATRTCPPDLVEYQLYDRGTRQRLSPNGRVIPGTQIPATYCDRH